MRFRKSYLIAVATFMLAMVPLSHGASIYVYIDKNGNRLITDHPRSSGDGYRLLQRYHADDNFGSPQRPAKASGNWRARSSQYDELIQSKARQLGLEPALIKAIIHTESAFNAKAISPKGATGLMQLMPATAERYGVTDRFNPVQSLEGGGRYMRDLLMMFNHDTRLALAAYNAGENAVSRHNGIPPYEETQQYVKKVMYLLDQYRQTLPGA